jgi:hypothetical protein
MIFFDGIHLMADSIIELYDAASRAGLKREWFQDHPRHPHYDVFGRYRFKFQVNCTPREMVRHFAGDRAWGRFTTISRVPAGNNLC